MSSGKPSDSAARLYPDIPAVDEHLSRDAQPTGGMLDTYRGHTAEGPSRQGVGLPGVRDKGTSRRALISGISRQHEVARPCLDFIFEKM